MIFHKIINRFMQFTGNKNDRDIAIMLKIGQSTFSEQKKDGRVPFKELCLWCAENGISTDWLFFDIGEPKLKEETLMVAEPLTEYHVGGEEQEYIEKLQLILREATDEKRGYIKGMIDAKIKELSDASERKARVKKNP